MSLPTATSRRKKNDDAPYFTSLTPTSGLKRTASGPLDSSDGRVKRKRMDPPMSTVLNGTGKLEGEPRPALVDFVKLPAPTIYRYLTQFDLIPAIYPSPLSAEDPPPPYVLVDPARYASRPPSPPAVPGGFASANRGRKEHTSSSRTRSSRMLEEDFARAPIAADVNELHMVLAAIAERHFREVVNITGREEVDTLASFMCTIEKAKSARHSYVRSDRQQ